tara:strand:- start:352 stop:1140 length:789 start_codon:yes stop_codon:yes gene_type:complete
MNLSGISIILPTLNEGKNLKILIPELLDVFSDLNLKNSEIIVSDDGSTDDTKEILNQIDSNNYDVFFHKRSAKPSLPMSIYEGIERSKNDYVMWLDADGSMPASMVKKMIETILKDEEKIIIASRFVDGGGYKGVKEIGKTSIFDAIKNVKNSKDSVSGMLASIAFNKLLIILLSSSIKDITSGFIIGNKKYFHKSYFTKSSYGEYFVYLSSGLMKENLNIKEIGYICETRVHGESKTANSILQLIMRGIPYIKAAILCRIK